jgi:hypothetical protein
MPVCCCCSRLVSNVLSLNLNAATRMIPDEPRAIIDGMLQLHPSDRSSLDELARLPWVSAAAPDLVDEIQLQLTCGECDVAGHPGGATGLCRLLSVGTAEQRAAWRRWLVYLVYGGLCAAALLSWQAQAGGTMIEVHLVGEAGGGAGAEP